MWCVQNRSLFIYMYKLRSEVDRCMVDRRSVGAELSEGSRLRMGCVFLWIVAVMHEGCDSSSADRGMTTHERLVRGRRSNMRVACR